MKRLLTFIYGLLCFWLATVFENQYNNTTEWYRYLYLTLVIVLAIICVEKLNKATE